MIVMMSGNTILFFVMALVRFVLYIKRKGGGNSAGEAAAGQAEEGEEKSYPQCG